jgi:hypothetical protein
MCAVHTAVENDVRVITYNVVKLYAKPERMQIDSEYTIRSTYLVNEKDRLMRFGRYINGNYSFPQAI